jgi:RNA polymerase sigma-70 factor, ECF subfamily
VAEPDDTDRRELLDRYCAAFENADLAALTELLQTDVRLEMPPLPVWFTGRDAVTRFLARRAFAEPGDMVLVPTAANGQPAVAEYRRAPDGVMRAHSIHVITGGATGIAGIVVFLDPELFSVFGLPPTR